MEMANKRRVDAVRTHRDVRTRAGRMLGACLLGLAVLLGGEQGSLAQSDSQPALFPNMTEAFVPRGSAQLLKPYLPKPEGETSDYRFVVEAPKHLAFVVAAKGFGIAPREVKVEPAPVCEGVEYARNVLLYDAYPAGGFELSLCWQDAAKHTIAYQPGIQAGGARRDSQPRASPTLPWLRSLPRGGVALLMPFTGCFDSY